MVYRKEVAMKNKGFTLIELLAVIILIGLIAVITIPKITKQVEDSKKNIAKSSAYSYKKAVNEYTLGQQMNKNIIELNGEYEITENGYLYNNNNTIEVDFSGEKPKNGYLTYINNELQSGCITINKYAVTFENGEVTDTKKGDCEKILQEKISKKVDSYVKAALTANSSITGETVKTVSEMSSITTNPADSGWIHFNKVNDNVVVVDYSLTYGDLTANYSSLTNGNYVSTFGETRNKPVIIVEGSTINIGEEEFYVMSVNNGTVKLLASNCLIEVSAGVYRQKTSSDTASCKKTTFSSTDYWNDSTTHAPKTVYQSDIDGTTVTSYSSPYPYVYNVQGTDTNNVDDIVNSYVGTLSFKSSNGAVGRLMSYTEANGLNSTVRKIGVKYWLGSGYGNCLGIMEDYGAINLGGIDYKSSLGVRPVIVISTSDI